MSAIEWTEVTWNPTRGCSPVSPGCANCFAMKQAHRFSGEGQPYEGLTKLTVASGPQWTGEVRFVPEMLGRPLRWKRPRMIFVNSMSDLFHDALTNEQIAAVFGVMAACPQHTFQVLTKRPARMHRWFRSLAMSPLLSRSVDVATCARERDGTERRPSDNPLDGVLDSHSRLQRGRRGADRNVFRLTRAARRSGGSRGG